MNILGLGAVVVGAAVFITVSATMNALFLSSLGRTPAEAGLLAAVSLAADLVKAVLPLVVARAIVLRAWLQAVVAGLMLGVVVALSLASGTGFAALNRGAAIAHRETQAARLAVIQSDLAEVEKHLAAITTTRALTVIEADLSAAQRDRRWTASRSCEQAAGPAARQLCADVAVWRSELVAATERDRLVDERQRLRVAADGLRAAGAGTDSDPQAGAIADLLGIDRKLPRLVLTTSVAVVLELGSVVLVLLAAGPTLWQWRKRRTTRRRATRPKPQPTEIPLQSDRAHWRRERSKASLIAMEQRPTHAR